MAKRVGAAAVSTESEAGGTLVPTQKQTGMLRHAPPRLQLWEPERVLEGSEEHDWLESMPKRVLEGSEGHDVLEPMPC